MQEQWPWITAVLVTIGLIGGIVYFDSRKAASPSATVPADVATVADGEWTKGNQAAPVTIIEYSDFQCPACGRYYPILKQLVQKDGATFRFVYRHFPLVSVHPNAKAAAETAEAAGKQGKFWEMHDQLFEHQEEWASVSDPNSQFDSYAKAIGLNLDQFRADRTSSEVKAAVEADRTSGNHTGVDSTPTFIINGEKLSKNPRSLSEFEQFIQRKTHAAKGTQPSQ